MGGCEIIFHEDGRVEDSGHDWKLHMQTAELTVDLCGLCGCRRTIRNSSATGKSVRYDFTHHDQDVHSAATLDMAIPDFEDVS